jgi:cyclopropane-fatty-acyl-phospholipid synthase
MSTNDETDVMSVQTDKTMFQSGWIKGNVGWGFAAPILRRLLTSLTVGQLAIVTPSGQRIERATGRHGPHATLVLNRWRGLYRLATGGDIGFAEAYMDGDVSCPDLTALIELAALNSEQLGGVISGITALRAFNRRRHQRAANSKPGSRRNIAYHYDLGNEFYRHWLDDGMTYSSALFAEPEQSLDDAQLAKQARAAALLHLSGGERILEIGCGWGGLAEHLIRRHDAHVTGLTLSTEQHDYARARLSEAGLADSADIRLQDYRDVEGRFDRIVSIEMFEAVGEEYWPAYFDVVQRSLARDGVAVLQIITIEGARFEQYRRDVDFIQRYIFPGGMLPSETALRQQIARAGLVLRSAETFGQSYAETLKRWQERFQRAWPEIEPLGFDQRFKRMWEYYLSYCEAGFRSGALNVGLYTLVHQ